MVAINKNLQSVTIDKIFPEKGYAFGHTNHVPHLHIFIPFWTNRGVVAEHSGATLGEEQKKQFLTVGGTIFTLLGKGDGKRKDATAWALKEEFEKVKKLPELEVIDLLGGKSVNQLVGAVDIEFNSHDDRMFRFWNEQPGTRNASQIDMGKLGKIAKEPIRLATLTKVGIVAQCEMTRGVWKQCLRNPLLGAPQRNHIQKPQLVAA